LTFAVQRSHLLGLCAGLTEVERSMITPEYDKVRKVLIWGLFSFDSSDPLSLPNKFLLTPTSQLSMMMGILPLFARNSVYVTLDVDDLETWEPYTDTKSRPDLIQDEAR